jgi:hypothetical protein
VDNYGDGSTPIVGAQIAAFQGHHQRPWTITEREFCNNLHKVRSLLHSEALFVGREFLKRGKYSFLRGLLTALFGLEIYEHIFWFP